MEHLCADLVDIRDAFYGFCYHLHFAMSSDCRDFGLLMWVSLVLGDGCDCDLWSCRRVGFLPCGGASCVTKNLPTMLGVMSLGFVANLFNEDTFLFLLDRAPVPRSPTLGYTIYVDNFAAFGTSQEARSVASS
jgi:hypothetical protein